MSYKILNKNENYNDEVRQLNLSKQKGFRPNEFKSYNESD